MVIATEQHIACDVLFVAWRLPDLIVGCCQR
jgi:hypothetical protein